MIETATRQPVNRQGSTNGRANARSIGAILKELTTESSTLFRQEVALAKTEMGEKAARVGKNLAVIAVGGLIAHAGVLSIIAAAALALVQVLNQFVQPNTAAWLGPLIIGVLVALVGWALVQKALVTLKTESLKPEKTLETLREDTQWLKDQIT